MYIIELKRNFINVMKVNKLVMFAFQNEKMSLWLNYEKVVPLIEAGLEHSSATAPVINPDSSWQLAHVRTYRNRKF